MNRFTLYISLLSALLGIFMCGVALGGKLNPLDIGRPLEIQAEDQKDAIDTTTFILVPRFNYEAARWIVSTKTGDILGYAPYNEAYRKYTLLNLYGQYRGFIQATVGESVKPEHYTQYLWYDRDNLYKGVMIATLGGRPKTEKLRFGELGGSLQSYDIGNIPMRFSPITLRIDYGRPPMGMNIAIVPRLR
jgi:hypothetical protein